MDEFEQRVARAVEALEERIATVHERVACPKCGAQVRWKCRRAGTASRMSPALKHSHRERLLADGVQLR